MKPTFFLASAAALVAIAGCNSNAGDAATGNGVKLEQVKPPAGGDWSQVYNVTEAGGMLMGNPDAKIRLIEYGSLTCPHCARVRGERRAATRRQICEERPGRV